MIWKKTKNYTFSFLKSKAFFLKLIFSSRSFWSTDIYTGLEEDVRRQRDFLRIVLRILWIEPPIFLPFRFLPEICWLTVGCEIPKILAIWTCRNWYSKYSWITCCCLDVNPGSISNFIFLIIVFVNASLCHICSELPLYSDQFLYLASRLFQWSESRCIALNTIVRFSRLASLMVLLVQSLLLVSYSRM